MNKKQIFTWIYFVSVFLVFFLLQLLFFSKTENREISYNEFRDSLQAGRVEKVVILKKQIYGTFKTKTVNPSAEEEEWDLRKEKKTPWNFFQNDENTGVPFYVIRLDDPELIHDLQSAGVEYRGKLEDNRLIDFISNWLIPFIFMMFVWGYIFKKMSPGAMMKLGKGGNQFKIEAESQENKVTFDDVAGIEEAKEELAEIVDFLKEPTKYEHIGARIPKGVLLVGPPGTGKTYVARAIAGESQVPFFNLSGSDFVEMFVGLGASRVRDLFKQAKEHAPCVIFIDEIDAIGKARSPGMGGNEERENTLNQLLTEMDGFNDRDSVIILAATNRPEVLDKALLRPGRFDRQIQVTLPDLDGREAILKVHAKKIPLGSDVDLREVAAQTAGFSGAELANLVNEAALMAARKKEKAVKMEHFFEAFERVIAGLEKKNSLISPEERKIVAYHESGHAIVGHFTPGADPIRKVSIVPRSIGALGYVLQTPTEDRFLMSRQELIGKIKGLLGGRAAEEIVFGEVSTGASNDLEKVTNIVKSMMVVYGMSNVAPNLSFKVQGQGSYLGQTTQVDEISDQLREKLDHEAIELVKTCYQETLELLKNKRNELEKMAEILLKAEVLNQEDVQKILGQSSL